MGYIDELVSLWFYRNLECYFCENVVKVFVMGIGCLVLGVMIEGWNIMGCCFGCCSIVVSYLIYLIFGYEDGDYYGVEFVVVKCEVSKLR